jgi:hypothetical protein
VISILHEVNVIVQYRIIDAYVGLFVFFQVAASQSWIHGLSNRRLLKIAYATLFDTQINDCQQMCM